MFSVFTSDQNLTIYISFLCLLEIYTDLNIHFYIYTHLAISITQGNLPYSKASLPF